MDGRVAKGKATRETLVVVARELFGRHGYDGTSVGAVLEAADAARGALYHHFATKHELFDAVLDREMGLVTAKAVSAAGAIDDPLASLRAGCATWLVVALDPAVQRIILVDAPAVVGWRRWRELDEHHTLGGLRAAITALAADGRVPEAQVDALAHMLLAAVSEAALMIAQADNPEETLADAQAALDTVLDRLFGARAR